jgi:aminopeptidase 2
VEETAPKTLRVQQCRFLSTGPVSPEEEDNTIWWVPLGIDLGPDTPDDLKNVVLTRKEMVLRLPNDDFYQLNFRKTGVFRVNYTPERLSKLGKAVKQGLLDTSDRIGVIADAGALAASGYGKTSGLLSLIKYFENENQYMWVQLFIITINICLLFL